MYVRSSGVSYDSANAGITLRSASQASKESYRNSLPCHWARALPPKGMMFGTVVSSAQTISPAGAAAVGVASWASAASPPIWARVPSADALSPMAAPLQGFAPADTSAQKLIEQAESTLVFDHVSSLNGTKPNDRLTWQPKRIGLLKS